MQIEIDGQGGKYAELLQRYKARGGLIKAPDEVPIRVETLDHGMQSGAPSIVFLIELPDRGQIIFAETSLKLFQMAAAVTLARYGDATEGAALGRLHEGKFELTLSAPAECAGCHSQIPGSCKFCPECGGNCRL